MRKGMAGISVGVLMLVLACTVQAADSRWHEYQSDNFTLHSDISSRAAQTMLADFETFRKGVLYGLGYQDVPENTRLRIVVYARNRDYNAIRPGTNIVGFFFPARSGPSMVIGPSRNASKTQVLYHEYLHYLLEEHVRLPVPRWYNEGFAELFASTEIYGAVMEAGKLDLDRLGVLSAYGLLPLEQLFAPFDSDASIIFMSRYYSTAGMLMHYLQVAPLQGEEDLRQGLAHFLYNINNGVPAVDAVEPSFGISLSELQGRLRSYYLRGRYQYMRFELGPYDGQMHSRRLSNNEAAILLAGMAESLGVEDVALDYLDKVDAARPDAARGLAMQAVMHGHKDAIVESARMRDRALELAGDDSEVLASLAHLYLDDFTRSTNEGDGDPSLIEQALYYANAAVEADPENLVAHGYQGMVLRAMGQHTAAVRSMMAMYQRFPTSLQINNEIGAYLLELSQPQLARPFFERVYNWSHDVDAMQKARKTLDEIDAALAEDGN